MIGPSERVAQLRAAYFRLPDFGMTDAERVEGVFEGHDADELARRLGYPHHFGMDRESLWNAIIALGDLEVVYRPWTLRLVKNMPEPYLVLFSHESDAVHFRLIA